MTHANVQTIIQPSEARPSLLSANSLYLVALLLVATLGSQLQLASPGGGLLATEVGLILLPVLVLLRNNTPELRATVQLRWPGGRQVLLAVLIGAGVWALAVIVDAFSVAVFGYAPPALLASLPPDPLEWVAFVLGLVVAAPVCEEIFFRGYLLRAYGRFRPWVSVVIVSVLFACFHLRLQGLAALVPVGWVLGNLTVRSRSLIPAMLAHAVVNGLSVAAAMATTLLPVGTADPGLWVGAMLIALLGGALAYWAYRRLTAAPERPAPTPAPSGWAYLPLAGAAVAYVAFAALELALGRAPAWVTERSLTLAPAPWTQPTTLTFDLVNAGDAVVGYTTCTLTPSGAQVAFACLTEQRAFDIQLGLSRYIGGAYRLEQRGVWQSSTMVLNNADVAFDGDFADWRAAVAPTERGLVLTLNDDAPRPLPAESVLWAEWPWRMMAMAFDRPWYWGSQLDLIHLSPGDGTGTVARQAVVLRNLEYLSTPAGPVRAWRVTLDRQIAWYRWQAPHDLLRFEDGYGVTWLRSD